MDSNDANSERVRRYSETQTARGLGRVPVWVPRDRAEDLRRFAAQLRREAGMLLPRESAASDPAPVARPPLPPGPNISPEQLLELMAAVRDEPPEKTLAELCSGRGPLAIAASFARIAGRIGYHLVWFREIANELAELQRQWIGTPSTAADSAPPPSVPSRNGPCPCGSGKKYKRCCANTKTKS